LLEAGQFLTGADCTDYEIWILVSEDMATVLKCPHGYLRNKEPHVYKILTSFERIGYVLPDVDD